MPVVPLEEQYEFENVGGEFGTRKVPAPSGIPIPTMAALRKNLTHALMYSFYWSLLIMNVR
jgi:hypothetical protein